MKCISRIGLSGRYGRFPPFESFGHMECKGVNGILKGEEMVGGFRKVFFLFFALTETKVKGSGEISAWG